MLSAKHRIKTAVIVLSVIFIILMRIVTSGSGASGSNMPSLFVNDIAFPYDDILPLYTVGSTYYVPILLFDFMVPDVVKYSIDNYTDHFYISYGGKFISFSIKSEKAWDYEQNELPGARAVLRGRGRNNVYIPARAVADVTGLKFELSEQGRSVRISDARASLAFEDMLKNPRYAAVDPPTAPLPSTAPPLSSAPDAPVSAVPTSENPAPLVSTAPSTTPENTREINNYLMFYTGITDNETGEEPTEEPAEDNLNTVLNYLKTNDIRALFFLSAEEITSDPDRLKRIFAAGHDIGININRPDFFTTEDLVRFAENANAYIYAVIKQKTRFYMLTADFDDAEYTKDCISAMSRAGYHRCFGNTEITPGNFEDAVSAAEFLKQRQVNLFAFDLPEFDNDYEYLELINDSVNIKFYINFSHINNANVSKLR